MFKKMLNLTIQIMQVETITIFLLSIQQVLWGNIIVLK